MNDQIPVEVTGGGAHFDKQRNDAAAIECGAVGVDRLSLDILHDEIRLSIVGMPGVEQPGDVGMRQAGKDLTLGQKAPAEVRRIHAWPQKLHGYLLRDLDIY